MFKNLLIDWVTELNEKIATAGDSGYLTISLSAFNPTLYAYIKTIMSTVVMPVAYVTKGLPWSHYQNPRKGTGAN